MNKAVPVLYRFVHGSSIRLGYLGYGWIRYRTERQKACSMRQIASYDKPNCCDQRKTDSLHIFGYCYMDSPRIPHVWSNGEGPGLLKALMRLNPLFKSIIKRW